MSITDKNYLIEVTNFISKNKWLLLGVSLIFYKLVRLLRQYFGKPKPPIVVNNGKEAPSLYSEVVSQLNQYLTTPLEQNLMAEL